MAAVSAWILQHMLSFQPSSLRDRCCLRDVRAAVIARPTYPKDLCLARSLKRVSVKTAGAGPAAVASSVYPGRTSSAMSGSWRWFVLLGLHRRPCSKADQCHEIMKPADTDPKSQQVALSAARCCDADHHAQARRVSSCHMRAQSNKSPEVVGFSQSLQKSIWALQDSWTHVAVFHIEVLLTASQPE